MPRRKRSESLPGERFGCLTVQHMIGYSARRKSTLYQLVCDCGSVQVKDIGYLKTRLKSGGLTCCGICRPKVMSGKNSPKWKGGKTKCNGYVCVQIPDHPAAWVNGYVLEHRVVMESIIGRYLKDYENVHHKNGIRSDNRPENLELWCSRQPSGQRIEDLLEYARWILSKYG